MIDVNNVLIKYNSYLNRLTQQFNNETATVILY